MYPNKKTFQRLAENYDVIPVCTEILADTKTPVSVFSRFAEREHAFLLESMEGDEQWGRYSFVGVDPDLLFEANHSDGCSEKLLMLKEMYGPVKVAPIPGLPRFFGGAVGFFAYEAAAEFDRMPKPKTPEQFGEPISRFLRVDKLVVFDNFRYTMKLIFCSKPKTHSSADEAFAEAQWQLEAMRTTMDKPAGVSEVKTYPEARFTSNMSKERFCRIIRKAQDYICEGDIIQVVLSRRMTAESPVPPLQLYRALRLLNPSPYTFFLKIGDQTLVGSSPEVMVRLTGNRVILRPIAGTRPRGTSEQNDRELCDELLSDEKEKAEHVMLVDLGRNDLGRISETGSVQVTEYMMVERYSHVMHIVSQVEAVLKRGLDAYDVIAATFPAGTLTGAPKIRAMEIIHELEEKPRGPYGGAIGYIGYDGNMDLAITIRTLEVRNGSVSVQVGAGIVFDSVPECEFQETRHKAAALQKAVELASKGLHLSEDMT